MKTRKHNTKTTVAKRSPARRSPRVKSTAAPLLGVPASPPGVREVCQRFRLVRQDLTRLTGYSLRAVDQWATGKPPAAPARKQLTELIRLFDALADLMDSKQVGPWLKSPNPAFANSTPLQVIERGEQDRLWRMIHQLETGEPE